MGKQGPCGHCGVTSTPLWRNGPPEKPILCNACGSRWRTKGTLVNYTPLHARLEPDEFEDNRISKVKIISIKNKEAKSLKRKQFHDNGGFKGLEEDTSNRSSSGSISNSDSCMQLGNGGPGDLTGQMQSSTVWDTMVPSRKRTCINRTKQTPVEKLTKDLFTILHEQKSYFSGSSEEDLIFENDTPMVSVEIGHGSVLIRHPNSTAREEESEASSLSFDTNNYAFSRFLENNANKGGNFSSRGIDMPKRPINQDQIHRNNDENLQILVNHNSPLCYIDLKDVMNFDEFASQLTNDEQQQLLKYLPPVDTVQLPDSLKSMFDSPQFTENLNSFQELLEEGVFDLSLAAMKNENRRKLKNLALCNATKSKWIEQYNLLQDSKCKYDHGEIRNFVAPSHSVNAKKSRDTQFYSFSGSKNQHKELMENDGVGFSPKSLFALPTDNIDFLPYEAESFDQDLLFDVPSHTSFPQAELLLPSSFA